MNRLPAFLALVYLVSATLGGVATFCSGSNGVAGWTLEGCLCDDHGHHEGHDEVDEDTPHAAVESPPACGGCRHFAGALAGVLPSPGLTMDAAPAEAVPAGAESAVAEISRAQGCAASSFAARCSPLRC